MNNQYFISKPFYDAVESACKTLESSKSSVEREMAAQSPPYAGEVLNLLMTRIAEIDLEIDAMMGNLLKVIMTDGVSAAFVKNGKKEDF